MNKIIIYSELDLFLKKLKRAQHQLVLVGGCFDILHLGHIRFLNQAKKYGTVVVALESDQSLTKYKGMNRPIHKQSERAEVLSQLETVDYILLIPYFTNDNEYYALTNKIKPDIIAATEGDALLSKKLEQAKLAGGKIIIIPKINTPSTTQLSKLLQIE